MKEREQIIIQNAVTKGLNPNAPMKDSGIDWICDIPAHWETMPNKRLFSIRKEIVGKKSADFDLLSLTLKGIIKMESCKESSLQNLTHITLSCKIKSRDKERLLDPKEPLRFIFSHSALREGIDKSQFQTFALMLKHNFMSLLTLAMPFSQSLMFALAFKAWFWD